MKDKKCWKEVASVTSALSLWRRVHEWIVNPFPLRMVSIIWPPATLLSWIHCHFFLTGGHIFISFSSPSLRTITKVARSMLRVFPGDLWHYYLLHQCNIFLSFIFYWIHRPAQWILNLPGGSFSLLNIFHHLRTCGLKMMEDGFLDESFISITWQLERLVFHYDFFL